MIDTVSALYVDRLGPYPKLVADWWDETRDARNYAGPNPVVAHPPCRYWSKLAHLATGDDDSDCGPRAVDQVRRWGGVLEHPKDSMLFSARCLPRPGDLPDAFGGRTIEVSQVDFGHVARKRTWLYCVRCTPGPTPPAREPTHWCSGFRTAGRSSPANYKRTGCAVPPGIKVCSAQQRRRTPVAFAEWLIALAAQARRP